MKKLKLSAWMLALALTLSSCGGGDNSSEAKAEKAETVETAGGSSVNDKGMEDESKSASADETMHKYGIFNDAQQEGQFHGLVGDHFKSFLSFAPHASPTEDLDKMGAKAVYCQVPHAVGVSESIIMWTGSDYYAALIDGNKEIRYFSTDPKFKTTLPKTIAEWCKSNEDYKIIYMNK